MLSTLLHKVPSSFDDCFEATTNSQGSANLELDVDRRELYGNRGLVLIRQL